MANYDPSKTYTWGPDTKFEISGQDFSLILHTFRGILATKEAQNAVLAYEANKKLEGMLASAVEKGIVVEQKHPVKDFDGTNEPQLSKVSD